MKKNFKILLVLLFTFGVALSANAFTIGNEVIDRDYLDTASNIAFVDPTLVFTNDEAIDFWEVYIGKSDSPFALQIYTPVSGNQYTLSAQELFASGVGTTGYHKLNPTSTMFVNTGDVIGWWFGGQAGVIPHSRPAEYVGWATNLVTPNIGSTYTFDNNNLTGALTYREYSISATTIPEPATMLLFGVGLLGIAGVGRRRNK